MSKNETPTKVIVPCRFSYLHCWEPEAINGGAEVQRVCHYPEVR